MTASDRSGDAEREEPPADQEFARAYAAGYEEGLRTALREILAHASRGRTNQELRALIQSRLARLAEEVDLKRRSLLAPPRPRPFGELARPFDRGGPGAFPTEGAGTPVAPGGSVLVRELRPERAVELVQRSRERFPRLVVVSLRPPEFGFGRGETIVVPLRAPSAAGGEAPTLGQLGGRLRTSIQAPGSALVYVDALEAAVTDEGVEVMLRFVGFLVDEVQRAGGALVVSYDPRALAVTEIGRLERLFGQVVDRTASPRVAPP